MDFNQCTNIQSSYEVLLIILKHLLVYFQISNCIFDGVWPSCCTYLHILQVAVSNTSHSVPKSINYVKWVMILGNLCYWTLYSCLFLSFFYLPDFRIYTGLLLLLFKGGLKYEGVHPKNGNYFWEGRPPVVQASPNRWVF